MARGKCTFRKRDVEMAIKAVKDGGCDVSRVRITNDGTIDVITGPPPPPPAEAVVNEWDSA